MRAMNSCKPEILRRGAGEVDVIRLSQFDDGPKSRKAQLTSVAETPAMVLRTIRQINESLNTEREKEIRQT